MDRSNKTVLVTGCSSGIGLEAAIELQKLGYNVVASCRKACDIEGLKNKGLVHVILLDLTDSESINIAIDRTLEIGGGKVFALFNNGAYGQPGAVEDLSREALRQQFETNVFGTHELTQKLIPHMLKLDDARIVQNSSVLGFVGMPFRGAYNASKHALEGLTDTMRLELRDTPIRVSLIEPGPILSDFRKNALVQLEKEIPIESSRHAAGYRLARERLAKEGAAIPFTLGADAVTKKLIHALESRNPKPRYYVTFPTYLLGYLKRLLTTRIFDKLVLACGKA